MENTTRTRKCITQEDVELMKRLYNRGCGEEQIAGILGCSARSVKNNLDPDYAKKKAAKKEEYWRRKEAHEEIRPADPEPAPVQMKMEPASGLPEGWIATELAGLRRENELLRGELQTLRHELERQHKELTDWMAELRRFFGSCFRGLMGVMKGEGDGQKAEE